MRQCEKCGRDLPEVKGTQYCPFCGAIQKQGLFEYDAGAPEQPHSPEPEDDGISIEPDAPQTFSFAQPHHPPHEEREDIHWERRATLGFLPAFGQTWSDSTFKANKFFRQAARTGNVGSALLYAFIVGTAAYILAVYLQLEVFGGYDQLKNLEEYMGDPELWLQDNRLLMFAFIPVLVIFGIFIYSWILHVCLLLVGSGRSGWEATFRVLCYSSGPLFFMLLPVCGGMIASIWQLGLITIGLREFHQSSTARVLVAIFLPLILCCGFIFAMFGTVFHRLWQAGITI